MPAEKRLARYRSKQVRTVLPEFTMSPHIVDTAGAAVDVDEDPESAVGADNDMDIKPKEAKSERRISAQKIVNDD